MAYTKKKKAPDPGYLRLREDMAAGTPGCAYIFYGEESYLREHYLGQLRRLLVPAGFEEFNYHRLDGRETTVQELSDTVEALPMMAERTLVAVTDMDLFGMNTEQRERMIALLEDVPAYCCLVFVYDTIPYKPDRTMKKLVQAVKQHVSVVEFRQAESQDLLIWVRRRFQALGKDIDRQTAEYLIFFCGGLMTGLVSEIGKIAAYAKGKAITQRDIDAVASPVLSAEVFKLSDAVLKGDYDEASRLLGDLLKLHQEPIVILAVLGSQLRRIYTARMAIDSGKDKCWLMDLWGMKSDYPAKLLLTAARRTTIDWCADAVKLCETLDKRMKSERGIDAEGELKLLLMRLGAKRT